MGSSRGYLRVLNNTGYQHSVLGLPGQPVASAVFGNRVAAVFESGSLPGGHVLSYIEFDLNASLSFAENTTKTAAAQPSMEYSGVVRPLCITPGSQLRWFGYSTAGVKRL